MRQCSFCLSFWVLRVKRATKNGNIGIFGRVVGKDVCEAAERTGGW